tara:strand:- start:107 stop:265 length:159 start_codon:yes stop_codon:yes gene_type:complete
MSPAQVIAAVSVADPSKDRKKTKNVSAIQEFTARLGGGLVKDTFDPSNPFGD